MFALGFPTYATHQVPCMQLPAWLGLGLWLWSELGFVIVWYWMCGISREP